MPAGKLIGKWESRGGAYFVEVYAIEEHGDVFYHYEATGAYGYLGSRNIHGLTHDSAIDIMQSRVSAGMYKPDASKHNLTMIYSYLNDN